MGVVAEVADRVAVMLKGEIVETGPVEQIFAAPQHPYSIALLNAVPKLGSMNGKDNPEKFQGVEVKGTFEEAEARKAAAAAQAAAE
jgi:ABC-type dipeptide/oligopeptide/nickel transport system ATPase component